MKIAKHMVIAALLIFGGVACADLDVANLNAPDRERALSEPSDVEALISGGFVGFWRANHGWGGGAALSVMGHEHTASWGNFAMEDFGERPRKALNNDPAYDYAYAIEDPWTFSYRALAAARDGIGAIQGGLDIGPDGERNQRAIAFAKFVQGIALGTLGALYDQAFIVDEDSDLEAAELQPHDAVMDAAIQKLNEAVQEAEAGSFDIPPEWVGGMSGVDDAELAQLAHSYAARFTTFAPRSEAERDALDWSQVASHASQGIDRAFGPQSNAFADDWFDILKSYGGVMPIWARMHIDVYGPADVSGAWEEWNATPLEQRTEFEVETPDRRVTGPEGPQDPGTHVRFIGPSFFSPERGTHRFSMYTSNLWWDYISSPFMVGFAPDFAPKELDFIIAEERLRADDVDGALEIINEYRVNNGQLPPATADGAPGGPDSCVPQTRDGECGDIWDVLKYEKRLEVWHYTMGNHYYDRRGWGDLVSGTALHFPVPGEELLTLLMDIYSHGGDQGDVAPVAGLEELELTSLPTTPEMVRERVEALERFDRTYAADRLGPPSGTH